MEDFNIICMPIEESLESKTFRISVDDTGEKESLYKFMVAKNAVWETIADFQKENYTTWRPSVDGNYIINVQIKGKDCKRAFDNSQTIKYIIGNNEEKLIRDVYLDKKEYSLGDKVSIQVSANELGLLYRYRLREKDGWVTLKDYTAENNIKFTLNTPGDLQLVVECKDIHSKNHYDDSVIKNLMVEDKIKPEIVSFKCISDEIFKGKEVKFKVEVKNTSDTTLFKFIKFDCNNKFEVVQDYSSLNEVTFIEKNSKENKLLCMVKDIYSIKEFDDRALLKYEIKEYESISIRKFASNFPSPQVYDTDIKFDLEATGGRELLYRFIVFKIGELAKKQFRRENKIKGKSNITLEEVAVSRLELEDIESGKYEKILDTQYQKNKSVIWRGLSSGKYKIIGMVKDLASKECEAYDQMEYIIEDGGLEPVKISNLKLEGNPDWMLVEDTLKISVEAEGGTEVLFSFKVIKDEEVIKEDEYSKTDSVTFIPKEKGNFIIEALAKDKYSNKEYDCREIIHVKVHEYIPGKIDYIVYPIREKFIVGEDVEFKIICQNIKKGIYKYKIKIDNRVVEESDYFDGYSFILSPKTSGNYKITFYYKNKLSECEYDDVKDVEFRVYDALPIINTKISVDNLNPKLYEDVTFKVKCEGGKGNLYEYYLMENKKWILVQPFSKKDFYAFMPLFRGEYKVLVLVKSMYCQRPYEDFDIYNFYIK